MATVTGPLFSVRASGTVAGAITFSEWKGRAVVRRHAIPANPRSGGQLSVRAMMKFLSQQWDGLSSAEQTSWDDRAAVTNISAFNAYVKYNMARWGANDLPSKNDPATEDDTAGVISTPLATPQSRAILVGVTVDTLNQNWGIAIFGGLTAAMGVTRNELIQVIPAQAAQAFTWLHYPLTPNIARYYRAYGLSEAGVIGNALDDWTGTPTT